MTCHVKDALDLFIFLKKLMLKLKKVNIPEILHSQRTDNQMNAIYFSNIKGYVMKQLEKIKYPR